jgi:hypothetical protein
MRDALTSLGLLGGALIALTFLSDDEPVEEDTLPKWPDVIPEWMIVGTEA